MCAATGNKYGDQWGIIAATGLQHGLHVDLSVTTRTWSRGAIRFLKTRRPTTIGVRMRWDQMGWKERPLWVIGGDGAMFDIGFQPGPVAHVRERHEPQGVRARYAGLFEHRRPGFDG